MALQRYVTEMGMGVDVRGGGLDVPSDGGKDLMVIVGAAVLVCFDD